MSETTTPAAPAATPATPTAARPKPKGGGHWYTLDGVGMFEVAKKDGKGMRSTTLADARKLNLVPSVTTILKILHKEALVNWMIEQAALAVLTAPRKEGEQDDAFVLRVLHEEEQQHEESQIARDRGTAIHDAIEAYFNGKPIPQEWAPYVNAPINAILAYGQKASSEVILVGDGYAGTMDLLQDSPDYWSLWDFKTTKKLPDPAKGGAWSEHRLQLSAYAKSFQDKLIRAGQGLKPIVCRNLYISTERPGEFVVCEHENWEQTYRTGFAPLVVHWQWANGYAPVDPNKVEEEIESANAEASVEIQNLRKHYQEANRRVEELEAKLKAQVAPIAPTPTPPAPQPAPQPQPRPNPAPPAPGSKLPGLSKDGQKLKWDVGTPAKA